MSQSDYPEPKRTLRLGDSGPDVKGLQKAINRTFKNRDLGRRVPNDSKMTKEVMKKGALAGRMVGVPEDNVKGAEKKDDDHKRIDERMQTLLRYGDKRSDNQRRAGKRFTDKFLADLEAEEASNDPDVINQWFKLSDYAASDGHAVPSNKEDDLRKLVINYHTPLREESGAAVYISSGYRTVPPEGNTNAACGGVSNSWHAYTLHAPGTGVASDIKSAKWSPSKVYSFMDSLGIPGLGAYRGFTHTDGRNTGRARWDGGY